MPEKKAGHLEQHRTVVDAAWFAHGCHVTITLLSTVCRPAWPVPHRADQLTAAGSRTAASISVNSRSMSSFCRVVTSETATATTAQAMKPGTISYIALARVSVWPPQMPTTTAPVIMPAMAPAEVSLRQNSDKMISGPNAAPKPAQAKPTRSRIVRPGSVRG